MIVRLLPNRSIFESALAAAEKPGRQESPGSGLNAPSDAGFFARLEEAWSFVKSALAVGLAEGWEQAREVVESTLQTIRAVVSSAGERAAELQDLLLERLRVYLNTVVDESLRMVRSEIAAGDVVLQLKEVALSQKLLLSNSLKSSLEAAVTLTSGGELAVSASYAR